MIGRTNTGDGGGLQDTDALLRVQAPAGSVVTISKGGMTKTDLGHENADDNSVYDYYFIIHQSQFDSVNPWTVTATLGGDSASDTIIINAADEYDVILEYTFYLFKSGRGALVGFHTNNNGSAVTTVIGTDSITSSTTNNGNQGSLVTDEKIDWTPYKTLHATIKVTSEPYNNDNFGLRMNITNSDQAGSATNPSRITGVSLNVSAGFVEYTVDLTNVNASYYFNIWGIGAWECTNIWATED